MTVCFAMVRRQVLTTGFKEMSENNFDIRHHKRTYEGFVSLTKYGTIAVCLVLIGMAVFLVN